MESLLAGARFLAIGRKGTDNLHKRRRYYVAKAIQESSMWPR